MSGPPTAVCGSAAGRAESILGRARWAARAFAEYPADGLARVVSATTTAASGAASQLAAQLVSSTGAGRLADTTLVHLACSAGLGPVPEAVHAVPDGDDLLVPRPHGVVLATVGGHHPVAGTYLAVLRALATRNAVLLLAPPGPAERAAALLSAAAVAAGAPDGCVQCWPAPWPEREPVAVPGAPPFGLDLTVPAQAPVVALVDPSADPAAAAAAVVAGVGFDHGLLPDAEDLLVVHPAVAEPVRQGLRAAGAHLLSAVQAQALAALLRPDGGSAEALAGRDAVVLAAAAGIAVPVGTRVLVAELDQVFPDHPLLRPLPLPLLRLAVLAGRTRAARTVRGLLPAPQQGRGRVAGVHAAPQALPELLAELLPALEVERVVLNAGTGGGPAGVARLLSASSLLRHVRVLGAAAGAASLAGARGAGGLVAATGSPARVPPYPRASNLPRIG